MATDQTNTPKTIARLGGFPLLGSSPVRWRLTEGVSPCVETFDVDPATATALLAARGPVKLEMISNDSTVTVENLYVFGAAAQANPFISKVEVADRRYWWRYPHVGPRRYNMRRKTGEKRVGDWGVAALDLSLPDFACAPYSSKNPLTPMGGNVSDRWGAEDATRDVLSVLDEFERKNFGDGIGEPIVNTGAFGNRQLIEDLEIDDKGDAAMQRMLKATPCLGMFLNLAGHVVLFNKADGMEGAAVSSLGPEMTRGGHITWIKNSNIRPREIHVLFTREIEVRFDAVEAATGGTQAARPINDLFMDNVLPVPDTFLLVGGVKTPQGTYITFDDVDGHRGAISSWGAPPLLGISTLNQDWIRTAMVPYNDMFGPIGITGTLDYNALWAPRMQAVQTNWRQTYRINRRWMDRIFQLRNYSIGSIDQATGQRSPARSYSDHCYIPAKKSLFKQIGEVRALGVSVNAAAGDLTLVVNVDGYPPSGLISDVEVPSPAKVTIPDPDQGILHIEYVVDPLRRVETMLPSKMEGSPTGDLTQRNKPISFDSAVTAGKRPMLSASHKIAIIVTAIPGSPNTEQQLHRVVVKPSDVEKLIPNGVAAGGTGPVLEIRVAASMGTALIPWLDAIKTEIEKAFGVTEGTPNLDPYVLNQKSVSNEIGNASLNSIAFAEAASAWAAFIDRFEGSAVGMLNSSVVPGGWLAEVVHQIGTDGVGSTTVNLPSSIPPLTLWSFLDKNTRKILMHSVEPQ